MIEAMKNEAERLCFRKAFPDDAGEVLRLYRSVLGTPYCIWNEFYPGEEEIGGDLAAGTLYVLAGSAGLVGAISVIPENEMDAFGCWSVREHAREFARVVIRPDDQGKGLSRLLVTGVLDTLRGADVPAVHISVAKKNIPAVRLYRSLGFTFCGEADMYGSSFYLCEKPLSRQDDDPEKEETHV